MREGNGARAASPVATAHHPSDKPDGGREVDTAVHPAILGDRRLAELEASLGERDAQLAEAERTIAEAAGELRRRARRKVLEGREALADAHARLEREVAHAMVLEAEIDRQVSLRDASQAEAEQRLRHLEGQAQREIAEAKAAGDHQTASMQAALERTRAAATADMEHARTGFEEKKRQLEVALQDTKAALQEARGRLDEERASRTRLDERLAAALDGEATATREADSRRRELELSRAELERLRAERARLRSELTAAEGRSRAASESSAAQAKSDMESQTTEQHREGGPESVMDESAPAAEAPPPRLGRARRRAAELQTELVEARADARAERERAARLERELEQSTAIERELRELRADLERLKGQSPSARTMRAEPGASQEPGVAALRSAAGIARAELLGRIRSRAKRAP